MTLSARYRQPWNMCEVNRLYNEYELQKLPIHNIAKLHQRGEYAILHKLASEGIIMTTWADVRGWEYPGKVPTVNSVFFVETVNSDAINSYVNSLTDDVECSDESSLEDNDDPNDSDYVYESDEDDEDYSDSNSDTDSDSDYEDEEASVDSDSDYEDESDSKDEAYDPYSIKQKARFLHSIISALKFFVYSA